MHISACYLHIISGIYCCLVGGLSQHNSTAEQLPQSLQLLSGRTVLRLLAKLAASLAGHSAQSGWNIKTLSNWHEQRMA